MDYSVTMGSFAFSPDSDRLACCAHTKGRRPFVQILSTGEGSRRLAILEGPALQADDGPVSQLVCAWFPDRLIFVCLARSTILVRIWDAQTFEAHFGWQDTTPIRGGTLLLSCDGRRLAVVAIYRPLDDIFLPTNTLRTANPSLCVLWDLETGGPREVLNARGAADKVLAASFDPQGERLVLSFADHAIRVWSVATRESLLSVAEPIPVEFDPRYHLYSRIMSRSSEVFSKAVVFSPDGRFLLSLRYMRIEARRETLAMLWDSRSGRPLLRWDDTQPSGGLCRNFGLALFTPAGTHVAFTANDGRVHMFDLSRGLWAQEDMTTQFGLRHDVTSLVLSPDGQTLCWGTHGGQVEIHSL
ncbi:WD40-repeat-containing domain protein [Ganoderma leucocontextum]|nr:WD40-repeat-containing domain protein [Ganoderma leucocontextum]